MAGHIKRWLNHFGLFREDHGRNGKGKGVSPTVRTGGFSVRAPLVDISASTPVVSQCAPGTGGVQGLRWYAEKLQMDEDGDVAQEFLDEVIETRGLDGVKSASLQVKVDTRPVKVKGPLYTRGGYVHQTVEISADSNGG